MWKMEKTIMYTLLPLSG